MNHTPTNMHAGDLAFIIRSNGKWIAQSSVSDQAAKAWASDLAGVSSRPHFGGDVDELISGEVV